MIWYIIFFLKSTVYIRIYSFYCIVLYVSTNGRYPQLHHSESFIALKISHVHPCSSLSPSNKPLAVTDHLKIFNLIWGKMHIQLSLSTTFRYKVALSTFILLCSQSPDFFSFSSCKTESLYSFKKKKKNNVFLLSPSVLQPPFCFLFLWIWLL